MYKTTDSSNSIFLHSMQEGRSVSTIFTIEELRSTVEETHDGFYQMTVDLAGDVGVEPTKKRTTGRQVHRENVLAESAAEYYRKAITIPFLNELMGQIQSRFSEGNLDALDAMYDMPNYVLSETNRE